MKHLKNFNEITIYHLEVIFLVKISNIGNMSYMLMDQQDGGIIFANGYIEVDEDHMVCWFMNGKDKWWR
jgi:hypothetical protein